MDWAAEGLLDGLDGEEREARARLLDALHGDGVGTDELRAAVEEDRLVLLPLQRQLSPPACYTLAELADRSGLEEDQTAQRLRALGVSVPDDPATVAFSDADVDAMQRVRTYLEAGMDADEERVLAHLMSGLMARAAAPIRQLFAETFLEAGDREDELGLRYGEMAARLRPLVAADLEYLLMLHLGALIRSDALGAAERTSGRLPDTFDVAVAFSDIVGFTALGEELPSEELTTIAGRLDELAGDTVRAPARVVKTIGDAVMVVSRDPTALVDSMADLMEAADDDLPSLRTGIAYGRAAARLGDWFGAPVNLASRLTARARPDSILVTTTLRDALGDAAERYRFSDAGAKRIKGIADPVPVLRLRRDGDEDEADA
jgi:adenylate cyclase